MGTAARDLFSLLWNRRMWLSNKVDHIENLHVVGSRKRASEHLLSLLKV